MATKEQRKIWQRRYLDKPESKVKRAKLSRDWRKRHREAFNKGKGEYRFRIKFAALKMYAGGNPRCSRCGFNEDIDGLCLDHINDNGSAHRKSLKISGRNNGVAGTTIYEIIKSRGFIEGLQVLCYNCNAIKEIRRKRGGITAAEFLARIDSKIRWT